jgi:hypothetical protein
MSAARAAVAVTFCATHAKGGNDIGHLPSQEHYEWLEDAVNLYRAAGLHAVVCMTGFPGIMEVPISATDYSRDVLWRVYARGVPVVSSAANPGHQHGAAFTIRMALEYAGKCDFGHLIVTAEDVMPRPGAVGRMLDALEQGADYAGEIWGVHRDEANAQFWACRVQALVPAWDHCRATERGWIERYLKHLLRGRPCRWFAESLYQHTHDKGLWTRWRDEQGGI